MGVVKSEYAKGLILERVMMMMMMIMMIMLRFSGCFLKGSRHASLEALTVVLLKVWASWDCNIWVLLTQGTTHCTTPRNLSLRIQSWYPYCIYDQVVYMLHCLFQRSIMFPKLSYVNNQNVALSPNNTSTTLLTNVHSTQNTPHTFTQLKTRHTLNKTVRRLQRRTVSFCAPRQLRRPPSSVLQHSQGKEEENCHTNLYDNTSALSAIRNPFHTENIHAHFIQKHHLTVSLRFPLKSAIGQQLRPCSAFGLFI